MKRMEIINEYGKDGDRLSDWRLAHPMGPVNEEEKEELETLVHNRIGSYMLFKAEFTGEIDADFIEKVRGLSEDWRS